MTKFDINKIPLTSEMFEKDSLRIMSGGVYRSYFISSYIVMATYKNVIKNGIKIVIRYKPK